MGWKGALRSISAANNRAKRAQERAARTREKASTQIDRIEDRLEVELARDRARVEQFEAKTTARPITAGGLTYDPKADRWAFKQISDDTGAMRWTLNVALSSDRATWSKPIVLGALSLAPCAIAVSAYGVFVAFKCEVSGSNKRPKLLFRSEPTRNRLYLTVGDVNYRAIEGTIDSPDIDGVGVVAFPLPSSDSLTGEVRLLTDDGTLSTEVSLQTGWRTLASAEDSLAKLFEKHADAALAETRRQIADTRQKISQRSSGCAIFVGALMLGATAVATTSAIAFL